jgi:hypothetical protein
VVVGGKGLFAFSPPTSPQYQPNNLRDIIDIAFFTWAVKAFSAVTLAGTIIIL